MTTKILDWEGNPNETAMFCQEAALAGLNDTNNSRWRKTSSIRGGTDNLTPAFAETCWRIAYELNSHVILEHLQSLLRIDELMVPFEKLSIDEHHISPGLIKYILRAVELDHLFDGLDNRHIVEIGGGWGGLAAVVHTMFSPASYVIYDLQDVMSGQKRTMQRLGLNSVEFGCNWGDHRGDLLVSDWAFSELTQDAQERYGRHFAQFPNGALMCQVFHYSKLSSPIQMRNRLETWTCKTVEWGPYNPYYLNMAFRHGDPRLMDAYTWRTE